MKANKTKRNLLIFSFLMMVGFISGISTPVAFSDEPALGPKADKAFEVSDSTRRGGPDRRGGRGQTRGG